MKKNHSRWQFKLYCLPGTTNLGVSMAARFRRAVAVVKVADDAFVKQFKNKRQQLKAARERAAVETGIELRRLQIAQQQGLKLPKGDGEDEEEDLDDIAKDKQAKIIRGMVIPYDQKRKLRFGLSLIIFIIVSVVIITIIIIIIIMYVILIIVVCIISYI